MTIQITFGVPLEKQSTRFDASMIVIDNEKVTFHTTPTEPPTFITLKDIQNGIARVIIE